MFAGRKLSFRCAGDLYADNTPIRNKVQQPADAAEGKRRVDAIYWDAQRPFRKI